MKNLPTKSLTKTLAGFMIVWLSGILFLFCPQMPGMQTAAKEICPLAKKDKSHCDKAKAENDSPLVSRETGDKSLDCCGFIPAIFDKTRKIEKSQKTVHPVAKIKVASPKFSFIKTDFTAFESYHSASFSQDKIFVKNCVFRI